jgi:hypothetical protein
VLLGSELAVDAVLSIGEGGGKIYGETSRGRRGHSQIMAINR